MKKIKLKIGKPLAKTSKIEKYFPLNNQWFEGNIQHQLDDLFNHKVINEALDNIFNNSIDILSNKEIFLNAGK